MNSMDRWSGRETRRLRHALRLTVRDFAEDIGVSPRTISAWEAGGAAREPRPELQGALDTVLGRASEEQRERFFGAAERTTNVASPGHDHRRPGVSAPGAAMSPRPVADAPNLPRTSLDQFRQFTEMVDRAREHDESNLIRYFARSLKNCQARDGDLGPVRTLPSALSVVGAVEVIARQVSVPVRRQLLILAARAAEFVGWLYRDAGVVEQATYWYDRGAEWAQEACNPPMQGYLLLRRSQMAYDTGDDIRVLTLSQAAQSGSWELPDRIKAEVSLQYARSLGMLGESVDIVERHVDSAKEFLSRAVPGDEGSKMLGATFTGATLQLRVASCYIEIGQPIRAADLFAGVLADSSLSRRDTGYFTARRAAALAVGGEPDEAANVALASVDIAAGANSQRTMSVLGKTLDALTPRGARPAVRMLRDAVAP
jgi:transcriptional regulator with XRE-family HTH domain